MKSELTEKSEIEEGTNPQKKEDMVNIENTVMKTLKNIKRIHDQNKNKNKDKKKKENKCPYGICGGSGIVINRETGLAKRCQCVQEKNRNRRLAFANIPKEFLDLKINQFKLDMYKQPKSIELATAARNITVNYVKKFQKYNEIGKGMYFFSEKKGSGKTRLAISCLNALNLVHNSDVKYVSTLDLLAQIKKTYGDDSNLSEDTIIRDLKNVEVLLLDDIGVERMSPWVADIFYNLINGRLISKKVTFFTSNVKVEDLKHGERIKNRIENMALPIQMPEESVRTYISRKDNEEMLEDLLAEDD